MADEVTPERVEIIAAAARIQVDAAAAERVARAVRFTAKIFAEEKISLPMEVEPSTFVVVARDHCHE